MSRYSREPTSEIILGDGFITLKRTGSSSPIIAKVLGVEMDASGAPATLWLDRLIHRPGERRLGAWDVSGAISTVLFKPKTIEKQQQ